MNRFAKGFSWLGLVLGSALLALQVYITVAARLDNGDSIVGALWYFATFFTVLTNFGVVLIHLFELKGKSAWGWIKKPSTKTMFAASIFVVMAIYHFVLSPLWQPKGLFAVADIGLHYVTPIIYLVWWVTHSRTGTTRYAQIPSMLVPPIIYLVWAMTRGLLIGEYPYPFLDIGSIGALQTGINVLGLFAGLAGLFALFIAIEHRLVGARAKR